MADPRWHYKDDEQRKREEMDPLNFAFPEEEPIRFGEERFVVEEITPTKSERLGNAVGEAVGSLHSRLRSGIRLVTGKSKDAQGRFGEKREQARLKAQDLSRDAKARMAELRKEAERRMREAKARTQQTVRERPLESILVVAGAALVTGFILRVWRSNRE